MVNLRIVAAKLHIVASEKTKRPYVLPKFRNVKHAFPVGIDIESVVETAIKESGNLDRSYTYSRIIEICRNYSSYRETYQSMKDPNVLEYMGRIAGASSGLNNLIDLNHPVGPLFWGRVQSSFKKRQGGKMSSDAIEMLRSLLECIETSADALTTEIGKPRPGPRKKTHVAYAVLELGKLFEELTGKRVTKNVHRNGTTVSAAGTGHQFIIRVLQAIDVEIPESEINPALEKRPVNP